MRRAIVLLLLGLLVPLGCSKTQPAAPVTVDAGVDAASAADKDEEVRAVYPKDESAAADPLATRLCKALHDLQEGRRALCCHDKPGVVLTSECTRTLSTALHDKAVTLAEADVVACEEAMQTTFDGCDWVGPFPPGPPAACRDIVHGAVEQGHACRSSLECAGALRCQGAGPTTLGKCLPPKPDGALCGGSVDTLATYVRQTSVDTQHPECKGFCNRRACAAFVAEGGACTTTLACGDGHQCIGNKCVKAAPAKLGEACPGQVCESGAECISGTCLAKKHAGEACKQDFECTGGCVGGKCAMKCGVR